MLVLLLKGWRQWSVGRSSSLVQRDIFQQLVNGLLFGAAINGPQKILSANCGDPQILFLLFTDMS